MLHSRKYTDTRNFLKRHHLYIKSDFNKFALYTFFSPIEPSALLFLLFVHHLTGSFFIAGLLVSIQKFLSLILQILLSGIKDRAELKYSLAMAESLCAVSYIFLILAGLFPSYGLALLCVSLPFSSIGGALWFGTYESFIYVDFEEEYPDLGSKPYSTLQMITCIGKSLGIIVTFTLLSLFSYVPAMVWGVVANLLAAFFALTLKGPAKNEEDKLAIKKSLGLGHFIKSTKHIFSNRKLKYIAMAEIINRSIEETFNSFVIILYKVFLPVANIGYVEATKELIAAVGFATSQKIIKIVDIFKTIKAYYIIRSIMILITLILNNVMSPVIMIFRSLTQGPMVTSVEYTMQNNYSDEERVAMSSSINILSRGVSVVLSCILGFLIDLFSIHTALFFLLPIYIIPYILYSKGIKSIRNADRQS